MTTPTTQRVVGPILSAVNSDETCKAAWVREMQGSDREDSLFDGKGRKSWTPEGPADNLESPV